MLSDESKAALHHFFIRAGRHMGRGIRGMDITPGEARVVRTIHLHGEGCGMNPSTISEYLGVRQPTLTPILNSLEERGYITRLRDKTDRRKVYIALTDKCRAGLEAGLDRGRQMIADFDECLTPDEIEQLIKIMKKLDTYLYNKYHKDGRGHFYGHHHKIP